LAAPLECSLLRYVNNSKKAWSILLPVFPFLFRLPKENVVDIFIVNFCMVMNFYSCCIEEIFHIKQERDLERDSAGV